MTDSVLTVEDLAVSFDTAAGSILAVEGVGFDLNKGETLGIVGESGCGKSVTALSLMRLLPRPSATIEAGRAVFQGRDIFTMTPDELSDLRGKKISMIFQEPMTALNPVHPIGRQIREVFDLHFPGTTGSQKHDRAVEMLEKVGIADAGQIMSKYPHHLSGGMRQRVMIAIALAAEPDILIADEPTTALDMTVQAQILELIQTLQGQIGMSVILITHDLGVIAQNCDRALVMYAGRVAEQALIDELFAKPSHPYTRGLLSSIPSRAKEPRVMLPTIDGQVPSLHDMPKGCRFSTRCSIVQPVCLTTVPSMAVISHTHGSACHFALSLPRQ